MTTSQEGGVGPLDLVVDVGNSETVVALTSGIDPEVQECWRISSGIPRTGDEFRILLRALMEESGVSSPDIRRAVVCSVVPSITEPLSKAVHGLFDSPAVIVRGAEGLPVRLEVEEPLTVGADRIVNTLGAMQLYGRNTIAVDLGTATTFDCITADGAFQGGVIAQGLQAGIDWLGSRTAKLPSVDFSPPTSVIGKRTEACMRSGVFFSATEGIDGIVRRILDEWGMEDVLVIATGGFADVVGPHCRTIERIEPFLTLQGLALAGEILSEQ